MSLCLYFKKVSLWKIFQTIFLCLSRSSLFTEYFLSAHYVPSTVLRAIFMKRKNRHNSSVRKNVLWREWHDPMKTCKDLNLVWEDQRAPSWKQNDWNEIQSMWWRVSYRKREEIKRQTGHKMVKGLMKEKKEWGCISKISLKRSILTK